MNNHILPITFAVVISCLTLSCSRTSTLNIPLTSEVSEDEQSKNNKYPQTADFKWLHDADPIADANLAIQKQDFNLLAFANS